MRTSVKWIKEFYSQQNPQMIFCSHVGNWKKVVSFFRKIGFEWTKLTNTGFLGTVEWISTDGITTPVRTQQSYAIKIFEGPLFGLCLDTEAMDLGNILLLFQKIWESVFRPKCGGFNIEKPSSNFWNSLCFWEIDIMEHVGYSENKVNFGEII